MKPLAVAVVAVVVLAAAAGAAYVVVGGGGDEELRPPKPATGAPDEPKPGGSDDPAVSNADRVAKPPVKYEETPIPRSRNFPDPGAEPPLPEELTPGAGQTFSVPWLADHIATADWNVVGLQIRRSILRARDYVAAARAYSNDADELFLSVNMARNDAMLASGRVFPVLAPFEIHASPAAIFSSPVAYGNAIAATLAAMNRPLSRAQIDQLQPILDIAVAEERELRSKLPPSGYAFDRDLARSELRAKLRTDVEAILDEDQRTFLSPPELRDRMRLDLFSPYSLWDDRGEERSVDDTMESVADAFLQTLFAPADPTRHAIEPTREFFAKEMIERIKTWPKVPNDVLSRLGHRPHSYMLACLKESREVAERYYASGILTPEQVAKSKAKTALVVMVVARNR